MDIRISRKQNIDAIQYDLLDHSILLPRLKPHQVFPVKNVIITRETTDDYCVMSGNDIEKSCILTAGNDSPQPYRTLIPLMDGVREILSADRNKE